MTTVSLCQNCGGTADPAHTDVCCTCFRIAFGATDHEFEHEYYEQHGEQFSDREERFWAFEVGP